MKRSPIQRKSELNRSGRLRAGRKTKEWSTTRASLKKRFKAVGITSCECWRVGGLSADCPRDNMLSFSHRLKRRKITIQEELETVALLTIPCHDLVERLPAEDMYQVITEIIEARPSQP